MASDGDGPATPEEEEEQVGRLAVPQQDDLASGAELDVKAAPAATPLAVPADDHLASVAQPVAKALCSACRR